MGCLTNAELINSMGVKIIGYDYSRVKSPYRLARNTHPTHCLSRLPNTYTMSLIVIYNPICGHGLAKALFEDEVIPLIRNHGREIQGIFETTHVGHAGEIVLNELRSSDTALTVILGSGDGTLHEIVNALHDHIPSTEGHDPKDISFVLVPCGTANALYSSLFPPTPQDNSDSKTYQLRSVQSFLQPNPNHTPLTVALTSTYPENKVDKPTQTSISVVVASTSLHASILHDSEALRASVPGIDRFKIAAQQNITRWYSARVKLLPKAGLSSVEWYDPAQAKFIHIEDPVELEGPFAYFLSTVNVDRLEPAFRITPLHLASGTISSSLEVVVLRPLRDPSIRDSSDESKSQFASTSGLILGAAYNDGAHVRMRFDKHGSITENGDGASVVEYYRCGGWEWFPVSVQLKMR